MKAFDISIFPGDPNRGHTGWMFSIRLNDGTYFKSVVSYALRSVAAQTAVTCANTLEGREADA